MAAARVGKDGRRWIDLGEMEKKRKKKKKEKLKLEIYKKALS
jgi:hypothetical protein